MTSYRAIQSFDHPTSWKDYGHEIISSLNIYPYVSRSDDDDDSIDELVETFSTVHLCSDQRLSELSSYEII